MLHDLRGMGGVLIVWFPREPRPQPKRLLPIEAAHVQRPLAEGEPLYRTRNVVWRYLSFPWVRLSGQARSLSVYRSFGVTYATPTDEISLGSMTPHYQ